VRIFIGFKEVAGTYNYLKLGFDKIGVDSFFLELWEDQYIYNKGNPPKSFWHKAALYVGRKRRYTPRCRVIKKIFWIAIEQFVRFCVLVWSLLYFDVYLFSAGSSFFNYLEFPLLKLLGKKIICQFHGSEVRPPYINGSIVLTEEQDCTKVYVNLSKKQKNKIKKIERYADVIINSVNNCHFNEAKVLDVLFLGKPFPKISNNLTNIISRTGKNVRILHSPSNLAAKGTHTIRSTIENLKAKGHQVDYIELVGVSNATILEEIQKCDFIIDQLYSDIFMPSFAKEAAFLGKPAIVGGYFRDCYNIPVFNNKIPPTVVCTPERFEETCERLIVDADYRLEMGKKVYDFVVQNWNNELVANRYCTLINEGFPENFFFDPKETEYLYGACLSKEHVKKNVSKIIDQYGIEALQLSDKPKIEQLFKKMAIG